MLGMQTKQMVLHLLHCPNNGRGSVANALIACPAINWVVAEGAGGHATVQLRTSCRLYGP